MRVYVCVCVCVDSCIRVSRQYMCLYTALQGILIITRRYEHAGNALTSFTKFGGMENDKTAKTSRCVCWDILHRKIFFFFQNIIKNGRIMILMRSPKIIIK